MVGPLTGGPHCRMLNLRNGHFTFPDIVDTFHSGLPKGGIFPRVFNYLSGPKFAHMSKVRNMGPGMALGALSASNDGHEGRDCLLRYLSGCFCYSHLSFLLPIYSIIVGRYNMFL